MKSKVLVLSPSRKCGLDLKVRGTLNERTVKDVAGESSVRIGNRWHSVTVSRNPFAPVRLVIPRSETISGLS